MSDYASFEEATHSTMRDLANLLIRKHEDYGPKNILNAPFGPERGLVVRLYDKLARLANLLERGVPPQNESLEDTWSDIANYGVIGLMVSRGDFTLPLRGPTQSASSQNPMLPRLMPLPGSSLPHPSAWTLKPQAT